MTTHFWNSLLSISGAGLFKSTKVAYVAGAVAARGGGHVEYYRSWRIHYSAANGDRNQRADLFAYSIHSLFLPIYSLTPSYGSIHDLNKITEASWEKIECPTRRACNTDSDLKSGHGFCNN